MTYPYPVKIDAIYTSRGFDKQYDRLLIRIKKALAEKEAIFKADAFDKRLKAHKLYGKNKALWSFSVSYAYRVTFSFFDSNIVIFLAIGTHSIYK